MAFLLFSYVRCRSTRSKPPHAMPARHERHAADALRPSAGTEEVSAARSLLRTTAPMRSPPSWVSSILSVDVHQVGWRFDLQFHQIKQIGAARDDAGVGLGGSRGGQRQR